MNCVNCGLETVNPKFCGRSCSASFNNKTYPKRRKSKVCVGVGCSEIISYRDIYCSPECKPKKPKSSVTSYDYVMRYRVNRRLKALAYLGNECAVCRSSENLEFDHIVSSEKTIEISQAIVASWSWEKLVVELNKCQLLCKMHHVEKSKDSKDYGGGQNKTIQPKHGTGVMYHRLKCRCIKCIDWRRLYRIKEVAYDGSRY